MIENNGIHNIFINFKITEFGITNFAKVNPIWNSVHFTVIILLLLGSWLGPKSLESIESTKSQIVILFGSYHQDHHHQIST